MIYFFTGCGKDILDATNKEQILKSPGYPTDYANNLDIQWKICNPYGGKIKFIVTLDIATGGGDTLSFYDGFTLTGSSDSFSGTQPPFEYVSISSNVLVRFQTDNNDKTKPGFQLTYRRE